MNIMGKKSKIAMFYLIMGMILPSFFIINSQFVAADYTPTIEIPVTIGNVLVYQADLNNSGVEFHGYYRYTIMEINTIATEQQIIALWEISEDGFGWTIKDHHFLMGNISWYAFTFNNTCFLQHRYFDLEWTPLGNPQNASDAILDYFESNFQMSITQEMNVADEVYIFPAENATHSLNIPYSVVFYHGIVESLRYSIYNGTGVERSEQIELIYEFSNVAAWKLNHWGSPLSDDPAYQVGDSFYYNRSTYFPEYGTTIREMENFTIQSIEYSLISRKITVLRKLWMFSTQEWTNYIQEYYIDYSLLMDLYSYDFILFVSPNTNFLNLTYLDGIEARNYWIDQREDKTYAGGRASVIYEAVAEKTINKFLTNQNYSISYSDQGYMAELKYKCLNYYTNLTLNLDYSLITPSAPNITNYSPSTTNQNYELSWDAVYEADSYNIYLNDELIGNSAENHYQFNFPAEAEYGIQISAVHKTRESALSSKITVTREPNSGETTVGIGNDFLMIALTMGICWIIYHEKKRTTIRYM
jgi:hypothetical protein